MSKAKCHHLPEFTYNRLLNGGILIVDATLESLRLGMMLSHFLIHVEYRNSTTMEVNIEVMHKKSVVEIKNFIEKERNNIVKYICKSESEFKSYLNELKDFVAAERRESRNIRKIRRSVVPGSVVSEMYEHSEIPSTLFTSSPSASELNHELLGANESSSPQVLFATSAKIPPRRVISEGPVSIHNSQQLNLFLITILMNCRHPLRVQC